jgi:hypothetical protein
MPGLWTRTGCRAAAALLAATLAATPAAEAHRLSRPKEDLVLVEPTRIQLLLTYGVSPGPEARTLRRLFDRDGDGLLSQPERRRLRDFLVQTARQHLSLLVNGSPAEPRLLGASAWGAREPVASAAVLGVRALFAAPVRWRIGENRLLLTDRHQDRAIPVVAALWLSPPFEHRFSSLGRHQAGARLVTEVELRPGTTWEVLFFAPRVSR